MPQQHYANYPSLKDRVVVITGGSKGIGSSMVENFALQGCRVIFLDMDVPNGREVVAKLKGMGVAHTPIFHECDLRDVEGQLKPTAAKILEAFPEVHILVNSACCPSTKPTLEVTTDSWANDVNSNLTHYFFLTQALLPGLTKAAKEEGVVNASIVNIGSINWAIPATGIPGYTITKSAIVGLTRTFAHEFGPKGIRVNSIMPGSTATERELAVVMTPEYEKKVLGAQAIKRLIVPAEIARAALWLASDDSSGMTNQSIRVDGGWT